MTAQFRKGDRVKASELWLDRSCNARVARRVRNGWYDPERLGTVQATPRSDCVSVVWDGTKAPQSFHHTFLVKVSNDQPANR